MSDTSVLSPRAARSAAFALVAGTLAGLVTMALHPTGQDVVHGASAGGRNVLVRAVHLLAIVGQASVMAGTLGIVAALRRRRDLAVGGAAFFLLASGAVIIAAAMSGFVAPGALRGYQDADEAGRASMRALLHYTGTINQAFALLYVVLTAIAILLWSSAILREEAPVAFPRGLARYGLLLGAALLGAMLSGRLPLDIHGFGLVVLTTGGWMTWAARSLWRWRADR